MDGELLGERAGLARLNGLPEGATREELQVCCSSARWAAEVASGRPFASADEIIARSDAAVTSPFGLDNPGEVFHAADRPYGLIQYAVQRDDAEDPGAAWDSAAAFA